MWTDRGQRDLVIESELLRLGDSSNSSRDSFQADSFVAAYANASRGDFRAICTSLFDVSRPDHDRSADSNFQIVISDSPIFDAYATIGANGVRKIVLTMGLFWALEDVVTRLACIENFPSNVEPKETPPLEVSFSSDEAFVVNNNLQISPSVRFYDYSQVSKQEDGVNTAMSAFFTAVPLTDNRRALAHIMLHVGLLWIMLHEESHHILGHAQYLKDTAPASAAAEEQILSDSTDNSAIRGRYMGKVLEWQADREATRGVLDVLIRPYVLEELPDEYASVAWLQRLVTVAVGCVITLFDRVRLISRARGVDAEHSTHPTDRTRFLALIHTIRERNSYWQQNGRPMWLSNDEVRLSAFRATRDLAIANRPAPKEWWPIPADWEPPAGSGSPIGGVIKVSDWKSATVDPFGDVLLHDELDARLAGALVAGPSAQPFGAPNEDMLLRQMYEILDAREYEAEFEKFVARLRKWVHELGTLVAEHNEWVWDELARYRSQWWEGSLERTASDKQRLTAALLGRLGSSYREAGRTEEAITIQEQVVADTSARLGPKHPAALTAQHNLAMSYREAGRVDEAIHIEEQVSRDTTQVLGDEHPNALIVQTQLAYSYWEAGRTAEAIAIEEKAAQDSTRIMGPDHPTTLTAQHNLALSYRDEGRIDEAIAIQREMVPRSARTLGDEHAHTLARKDELAISYWKAGRTSEAIDVMRQVVAGRLRTLGADHPDTQAVAEDLQSWIDQTGSI